jgi:hypothetical protein
MTTVLGVDPCPGGWVGVELRDGRFASAHVGTRLNELIGKITDAAIIGVDVTGKWTPYLGLFVIQSALTMVWSAPLWRSRG